MIKVENIDTWGVEHAIRGMRNPYDSWDKSDSYWGYDCNKCGKLNKLEGCRKEDRVNCEEYKDYVIGPNDLSLMKRLFEAGTEHRKYLRQIMVSMDITAPFYWWKEFDTYKVGTVANSCSTMHTIAKKEFTLEDFSIDHLTDFSKNRLLQLIEVLNAYRDSYLNSKNKEDWWQLIQLLPMSYNQKRTITMNYENVFTMIKQRTNHKLDEWNEFVKILKDLPYVQLIHNE